MSSLYLNLSFLYKYLIFMITLLSIPFLVIILFLVSFLGLNTFTPNQRHFLRNQDVNINNFKTRITMTKKCDCIYSTRQNYSYKMKSGNALARPLNCCIMIYKTSEKSLAIKGFAFSLCKV